MLRAVWSGADAGDRLVPEAGRAALAAAAAGCSGGGRRCQNRLRGGPARRCALWAGGQGTVRMKSYGGMEAGWVGFGQQVVTILACRHEVSLSLSVANSKTLAVSWGLQLTAKLMSKHPAGGLTSWRLWYLSAAWFMISCSSMGVLFWVPLLLKAMLAGDFGGHVGAAHGAPPPASAHPHSPDREQVGALNLSADLAAACATARCQR